MAATLRGACGFALEVAEVTRDAWPADKPVFFRVSCVDGKGGIWGLDDTVELSKALKERDIDLVDCSSGGITGDTDMPMVPRIVQFQAGFAERIRREADIMTIAVGGYNHRAGCGSHPATRAGGPGGRRAGIHLECRLGGALREGTGCA